MEMQSLVRQVETYTQEHLSQYIQELTTLCAIDSYSYYKPGLDEVANWLGARMQGLGMDVKLVQRERWGNDLLGTLSGEGTGTVLLLGHMDTVYPVGTAATRPVRLEGDVLYGPGVCDMKGCILSAIYAIEVLRAASYRGFGEIRFLCVSDEEINERHCQDVIEQACKGSDGVLVLEAARANGDIVSARKGNAWYTLTARGRSAHAGVEPEKGRNAVAELSHQIVQFQYLNNWRPGVTVNPGVISGGTLPNVIPDYAQARFDVRFLQPEDRLATEERMRKLMQKQLIADVELTLEMEPDFKSPMRRTPEGLRLATRAQEIAGLLGLSINHVLTGGASDGSYASSYGLPVLDGLGPIGGRDHSPNEYLMANSVASRTALLAGLIAFIGESAF